MGGDFGPTESSSSINSDNYDYITFYDQLSHPVSFQPSSTITIANTPFFTKIYKFVEDIQLNVLHFMKQYMITLLYTITFIDPELSFL
jgi:hypothetical protein